MTNKMIKKIQKFGQTRKFSWLKATGQVLFLLLLSIYALPASETLKKSSEQEEVKKLSLGFGHFIGRNLKNPGVDFDLESVITGMRDGAAGKPAPMSDEEYETLLTVYQEKAMLALQEENLKKANDFLDFNRSQPGVVVLEPGKLHYLILEQGQGKAIEENSSPSIHYTGKFIDGQVFGSSEQTGGPITLSLAQTIQGFKKGIVGMLEGEKRRLFLHPDLGYGTQGTLPPNSLLIFDIQIVKSDVSALNEEEINLEQEGGETHDFELPNW